MGRLGTDVWGDQWKYCMSRHGGTCLQSQPSRTWGRRVVNVSHPELHSGCWISLRSREIPSPKPSTGVLVFLSVAGETLHQTQLGEKRIHFRSQSVIQGSQGRDWSRNLEEHCSSQLLLSQPAYTHARACTHKHTNKCNLEIKRMTLNWLWWYM